MKCFDRIGERARLKNSLKQEPVLAFVTGRSGVGKTQVIGSVLDVETVAPKILRYAFGRNPLPFRHFLFSNAQNTRNKHYNILDFLENISVGELSLSIPFIGKAPIRWKTTIPQTSIDHLNYNDIVSSLSSPVFLEDTKIFSKISEILGESDFRALWIENSELASSSQFGQICLATIKIAPFFPVIIEGAFSDIKLRQAHAAIKRICENEKINFFHHDIRPFNPVFARRFYDQLDLRQQGVAFDYRKNAGYPVAIKYDLENMVGPESVSSKIQSSLNHSKNTNDTLVFLSIFYSIENRYDPTLFIHRGPHGQAPILHHNKCLPQVFF